MTRSNPFEAVPTAAVATSLLTYISEADALKVLDQITPADLRLLFVLARWGGLRVVSEPKALTWDAVDWGEADRPGRLTVASPKTRRHAGHESRVIPMFPELVGPLRDAFERATTGEPRILLMLWQKSSAALRDPMFGAIKRAGVKPWPRLWHKPALVSADRSGSPLPLARRVCLARQQHDDRPAALSAGAGQRLRKSGTESGTAGARTGPHGRARGGVGKRETGRNADACGRVRFGAY